MHLLGIVLSQKPRIGLHEKTASKYNDILAMQRKADQ